MSPFSNSAVCSGMMISAATTRNIGTKANSRQQMPPITGPRVAALMSSPTSRAGTRPAAESNRASW